MADNDDTLSQLHLNRNQLLHNAQANFGPSRVAPPMPTSSFLLQPPNTPAAVTLTRNNRAGPRNYRRVPIPAHQPYVPSSTGSYNGFPRFSNIDAYNNLINTLGQQLPQLPAFENPIIIAASENARPAFEQIYTVVESFNAISVMLESTYNAMQTSYNALLGVADNFTRIKVFIMKFYSAIVSIRLARWFLIKIMYLLRMVNGNKRLNDEENVWASLSTTGGVRSNHNDTEGSWPLVVFSGALVSIPYLVYKLMTPKKSNSINSQELSKNTDKFAISASNDWDNQSQPNTIPLVRGQQYVSTIAKLALSNQNGGWLFVEDQNGQRGFVPTAKLISSRSPGNAQIQPLAPEIPDTTPQVIQTVNQNDVIPEQITPFEDFDE